MKEKKKVGVLVGLFVAAALVWYMEVRQPSAKTNLTVSQANVPYAPLPVENPAIQWQKMEAARQTEYKSGGRDLFSEVVQPPPVLPAPTTEVKIEASGPPPPPPPPSLPSNVKFFGYGTIPNGTARRAFLTDGDNVFIVGEGDTLLGKYRVVRIGNANLDFEEIATGRRGSTTLDEQAAPPA
jgi:hypothetical protein